MRLALAIAAAVALGAGPAATQGYGTFAPNGAKPPLSSPGYPGYKPPSLTKPRSYGIPAPATPSAPPKPKAFDPEPPKPPAFKPYEPYKPYQPPSLFGPDGRPKRQ